MLVMSQSLNKAGIVQKWKPVYAGFLLGLFLSVWGMAQFQTLHKALHCDADHPDHHCAVTLLSSGLVDLADGPPQTVAYTFTAVVETFPAAGLAPSGVALLPFSRGPPALLA
jgi:hypothetical protein